MANEYSNDTYTISGLTDEKRALILRYFPKSKSVYFVIHVIGMIAMGSSVIFTYISQQKYLVSFNIGGVAGAFEGNKVIEISMAEILFDLVNQTPSKTYAYILDVLLWFTCCIVPSILPGLFFVLAGCCNKKK